jgi:SAM-dependent methyltransferase
MNRTLMHLALLALGISTSATAQELRRELPARAPAQVMSYRGAGWLERPERVAEEMPDEVMATLAFEDGDVVADLGAGSGFYTRRIARAVAPSGNVYAVDIQPEMLDILRENVGQEGITNVVPVLGETDDPKLPTDGVDWMILADVYHEFSAPEAMLAKMREALRSDGRIALLEYRVEDGTGDHIQAAHRMSVRQVMIEWEPAGFELVELHEFLPGQHLFVFQEAGGPRGRIVHHDLLDAMARGLVEVVVRGESERSVRMTVTRTTPEPMVVTFPVGTYFDAPQGQSDMVALRDGMVLLADDETHTWSVQSRLSHPTAGAPGSGSALEIEPADDHRRERNVMWVYQGLDFPAAIAPLLEQSSLWMAASDVGYDDLAGYLEGAPLPSQNAIALALAYFESAGMDPTSTRIFAERDRYLPSITDPSLLGLFEQWGRP